MSRLVLAALAAALLGACGPSAIRMTAAPAGKTAEIDAAECTMSVSTGVVLAFECRGSGSCNATTDDGAIAEIRRAFINETSDSFGNPTGQRDVFVLVGKTAGSTTVHLGDDSGTTDFSVSVEP